MNNFPFIDIFILAMVAVFIINRLKNTLGKKTGNEADIAQKFNQKQSKFTESNPDKELQDKRNEPNSTKNIRLHKNNSINQKLNKLTTEDQNFSLVNFLDGAKKAFEFILAKYSENDVSSLKPLLADDIFTSFSGQIKDRQKKKEKLGITILSIDEPEIIDVVLKKDNCSIKLEFKSQQVQTTKDSNDNVIEGNDNLILNITELWTFSKKISSKNPNWILEKIEEKN